MKTLLLLAFLAGVFNDETYLNSALILSGASCIEELDEEEIELYRHLHEHPLAINTAPRARLQSSGLFSVFQIESLLRYREEYGEILSITELSMVSGFGRETASALADFISLDSRNAPGQRENRRKEAEVMVRGSVKKDGRGDSSETQWTEGIKASLSYGDRAELHWASRTTYSDPAFKLGTLSAAWYGKRIPVKVVAGNFAARFGQGLTQWSGFSLSSLNSVSAFSRNGSGLSSTTSFSPSLLGVGADVSLGRFVLSAAGSWDGAFKPIGNIAWSSDKLSLGLTCTADGAGIDLRLGLPDTAVSAEVSRRWSGGFGAVAAIVWTPVYGTKVAFQGRFFEPSFKKDYSGAAACFENGFLTVSADAARHFDKEMSQYKMFAEVHPLIGSDTLGIRPALRCGARCRDGSWRMDLRGDLSASCGPWRLNARYNLLWCRSRAWLWYAEPGIKGSAYAAYLRFTLFRIDNWDDRIYVYERDAPGSFNVPAYYGRGLSVSLAASASVDGKKTRHRVHLRAAYTAYPWNPVPKASRLEIKLQYDCKWFWY